MLSVWLVDKHARASQVRDRVCVVWHQALAAPPALVAKSLKDLVFILEAEHRSECRPRERLANHLSTVPEDETRAVQECRRDVPHFHPPLLPPPQELDF